MTIKLFIDDIRQPSDVGFINSEWVVARTYSEAMRYIESFKPQLISFDHDLGYMQPSGFDIAKELLNLDMDLGEYISSDFKYYVHSANPIGAENIRSLLDNYIDVRTNGRK